MKLDLAGEPKRVKFHFDKIQVKHDEWVDITSPRLAPLHSMTSPPPTKHLKGMPPSKRVTVMQSEKSLKNGKKQESKLKPRSINNKVDTNTSITKGMEKNSSSPNASPKISSPNQSKLSKQEEASKKGEVKKRIVPVSRKTSSTVASPKAVTDESSPDDSARRLSTEKVQAKTSWTIPKKKSPSKKVDLLTSSLGLPASKCAEMPHDEKAMNPDLCASRANGGTRIPRKVLPSAKQANSHLLNDIKEKPSDRFQDRPQLNPRSTEGRYDKDIRREDIKSIHFEHSTNVEGNLPRNKFYRYSQNGRFEHESDWQRKAYEGQRQSRTGRDYGHDIKANPEREYRRTQTETGYNGWNRMEAEQVNYRNPESNQRWRDMDVEYGQSHRQRMDPEFPRTHSESRYDSWRHGHGERDSSYGRYDEDIRREMLDRKYPASNSSPRRRWDSDDYRMQGRRSDGEYRGTYRDSPYKERRRSHVGDYEIPHDRHDMDDGHGHSPSHRNRYRTDHASRSHEAGTPDRYKQHGKYRDERFRGDLHSRFHPAEKSSPEAMKSRSSEHH